MKILIAIISNRNELPKPFVTSLNQLKDYTSKYHKVKIINPIATYVDQMRNIACRYAQLEKYDYVFQVDDDMIYPSDTIIKLLKHKKEVIGGKYYMRKVPHKPCHWKKVKMDLVEPKNFEYFKDNKLKKVGASGFGGVLIKVKSLNKIKYPYFQVRYRKDSVVGEDIDFCFKIKNKIDFYIDPTVEYAHLHQVAIIGENKFLEIY